MNAEEKAALLKTIMDENNSIEITETDINNLQTFFADWKSDPSTLTAKLKAQVVHDFHSAMEEQGISKSTLAQEMNVSRQYVGRVLSEKSNFTLSTLARFSTALCLELSIQLLPKYNNSELSDVIDCLVSPFELQQLSATLSPSSYGGASSDNCFSTEAFVSVAK